MSAFLFKRLPFKELFILKDEEFFKALYYFIIKALKYYNSTFNVFIIKNIKTTKYFSSLNIFVYNINYRIYVINIKVPVLII